MRRAPVILSLTLALAAAAFADYTDQVIVVPAGSFIMGDGTAWCGTDEREVTLTRPFFLGRHEVTNREYLEAVQWAFEHGLVTATVASVRDNLDGSTEELLDIDSNSTEIRFDGAGIFYLQEASSAHAAYPGGYDPADHPVKEVTWFGAVRFCDWLSLRAGLPRAYEHGGDWSCNGGDPYGAVGYRLPTDAEWEYAAQFDDERIYPWGSGLPNCSLTNYNREPSPCVGWTTPVGSYPDAPEVLGLSDMAGNVFEWCNDWHVCDLGTTPEIPRESVGTRLRRTPGSSWWSIGPTHSCIRHGLPTRSPMRPGVPACSWPSTTPPDAWSARWRWAKHPPGTASLRGTGRTNRAKRCRPARTSAG